MELELKHLAGYLPYGLGIYSETYGIKSIMTIRGNGGDNPSDSIESVLSGKFKPLLRPLSSLIKEIEVGGLRFVPIDWIKKEWGYKEFEYQGYFQHAHWFKLDGAEPAILHLPYCFIQKLHEWHFDICGLIDKGLAIAIED